MDSKIKASDGSSAPKVTGYDSDIQKAVAKSTAVKGYTIKVGDTTYFAIDSTVDRNGVDGEAASVSQVVDYLNEYGKQNKTNGANDIKAFASMDEMMSAIKNDF